MDTDDVLMTIFVDVDLDGVDHFVVMSVQILHVVDFQHMINIHVVDMDDVLIRMNVIVRKDGTANVVKVM